MEIIITRMNGVYILTIPMQDLKTVDNIFCMVYSFLEEIYMIFYKFSHLM